MLMDRSHHEVTTKAPARADLESFVVHSEDGCANGRLDSDFRLPRTGLKLKGCDVPSRSLERPFSFLYVLIPLKV